MNPEAVKIMLQELLNEVQDRPGWYLCIGRNSWTGDKYCDIGTSDGGEPESQNSHPTSLNECIVMAHRDLKNVIARWEEYQDE